MAYLIKHLRRTWQYIRVLCKWSLCAGIIGLAGGVVGALFHELVDHAASLRGEHHWILYLLPAAGLLLVFSYRMCGVTQDRGTNLVLTSLRSTDQVPVRIVPLIILATTLTHLCGGSSGREGAALQIGSGLSTLFGHLFRFDEKDRRLLTMCGMSAVFSAVFGTPVTAAIFSLEVVVVGVVQYSAFFPCIVSGLVAWETAQLFGLHGTSFTLAFVQDISLTLVAQVAAVTLATALCSILYIDCMHLSGHLYQILFPNPYLRIVVGGALVIGITMLLGTYDYNGAGMDVITRAIGGDAENLAFLWKILLTALTLGAGFKGGEIVPSFFVGATFGCVVAPLLGLDAGFGAAVGLVAFFCSVVNCPLASLALSLELFGGEHFLLFALVCALSYSASGYYSLYSVQKIFHSKLIKEPK